MLKGDLNNYCAIPVKIPITFYMVSKKPKIHVEVQKTLSSQIDPEQNEQHWTYTISDFKI